MLERSAQALEKWKGFDQAIDRWLEERHDLILQLSDFAANHDFDSTSPRHAEKLKAFSATLIDYISAGHFEFYQRLVDEGREFGDEEALSNTQSLLEAIDISTQSALDFNEKYEDHSNLDSCADDLSSLAESLVVRFDAEDEMINCLHKAHFAEING